MRLPLSIDEVPYYKIAGQYCFKGDLIFTAGIIYFFPLVDMDRRRAEVAEEMDASGMILLTEFLMKPLVFPLLHAFAPRSTNHSRLKSLGVWKEIDTSGSLQSKLDRRLAELKRQHTPDALPLPSRFVRDEIGNLRLSSAGALSFDAQSDRHDFAVGVFRRRLVREALAEGGFIDSRRSV